jgi:AAA+ superfamily predicted ATPase
MNEYHSLRDQVLFYSSIRLFTFILTSCIGTCHLQNTPLLIGNTKSILLQGPIGVGKSTLIESIKMNLKWPVFTLNTVDLCTLKSIESIQQTVFQVVDRARQSAPSLIWIQNLDILSKEYDYYDLNTTEIANILGKGFKRLPYRCSVCIIITNTELRFGAKS